ncbi:MAG: nucleotidyltransferase family protein [Gemmataceae bacterium]|nr:nucleotidyltransferase family protein [Gemmataceae bacterium]
MDAIIMAAGLGTRLRPYTLTTPKPMLPVRGRPILDWTVRALPAAVRRLIVVTHYLKEQVEEYVARQSHVADCVTVFQATPRGTGDAFLACRDAATSDSVLVLNGDDLYSAGDLARLAAKPQGLLAHPVDEPKRFGIVFPRPDGTIEKLVEKPDLTGTHLANIGAYLFPRSAFDIKLELSPRGEYEITDVVADLIARGEFHAVPATTWLPIGTEEQWRAAEQLDLDRLLGA